eukprot:TRINITY_DN65396_c0_g1_i1.p1 TRINITY_DN65396_c0_g1~~TRINITY_DN65396_c0_g1_i1.p1  ORF type:complete len:272 (-),score=63.12 TRINITY_DN65396_c0_g1_i1:104-817(-)
MPSWDVDENSGTLNWCPTVATPAVASPTAVADASTGAPAVSAIASSEEAESHNAAGSQSTGSAAVAVVPAPVDRADLLFEDAPKIAVVAPAEQETTSDVAAPLEDKKVEDDDESSDDEEGDEFYLAAVDEMKASAQKLQALLADTAAFHEACEKAIALPKAADGEKSPLTSNTLDLSISSPEDLRDAMNFICRKCDIEEVDDEEACELFDGPMDSGVFYCVAREYFSSLSRTLVMGM